MKKLFFVIGLYTLTGSFLWGAENIAEAIIVRGKVTVLELGELQAKVVKRGTKFKRDASILTGPRSFIRIRFSDKSIASLGPNSKMVVNQVGKKRASIISLIKGKLRTKVIKKISKKSQGEKSHSLYIKTVTASMGVRGTDFQVLYNKKNKVTSLLTYEGKVQISKNETRPEGLSKKTDLAILEEQTKQMEKVLNSKESVTVPKGQFSGVSPKLKKTTLPVKISPKQFTLLYKNDELKGAKSLKEVSQKDYLAQAEQKAPLEGVSETKSGDFAPRSGGFLDLETGLYVAPGKKSKFNKKLGVYEDKNIGSLSSKTGKYLPPKGLKLDSVKGFVPNMAPKNKKEADKIKKRIKELNEGIKKQKNLLTKKLDSFIKKIKEIKLKKPKKIKSLLDPNLLPDKGELIYGSYVGLKNYSEEHDSNSDQESIKESFMAYLSQGLTYGLTSKLSVGVLVNLYFPLSSKIDYGPGALDGVSLKQEYEFDHEGPFLSTAYKNKQGVFKFIFKPKKEKDFAAITDPNGNVLQKGSHSLKERYISLSYKKTWKKEKDFYSSHIELEHFGGKEEIVDVPLHKNIIQGSRNTIRVAIEGQRNLNLTNAIRVELNLAKSTSMSYQTADGSFLSIENLWGFDQKFSYLHQNKLGLWSLFLNREKVSGVYGSDGDKVSIGKINLGLSYIKDFSL